LELLLNVACKYWGIAPENYEFYWENDEKLIKYDKCMTNYKKSKEDREQEANEILWPREK
jgi:hypothetical protein